MTIQVSEVSALRGRDHVAQHSVVSYFQHIFAVNGPRYLLAQCVKAITHREYPVGTDVFGSYVELARWPLSVDQARDLDPAFVARFANDWTLTSIRRNVTKQ